MVAATLNSIASVLLSLERQSEAEDHCQTAISLQEKLNSASGSGFESVEIALAKTLNTLGSVQKAAGRLDDALSSYLRSLSIREQRLPSSPETANSLNNIGAVYLAQGKLVEAREYVDRSTQLKKTLGVEH